MKKLITVMIILSVAGIIFGQENKSNLKSEKLDQETARLNKQISDFSGKIENVIVKYKLENVSDITVVPYQTSYANNKDYLYIEKHKFIRDDVTGKVIGLKKRSVKLYLSGGSLSKIESEIFERNYVESKTEIVTIVDPSPTTEETSDISFNHVINGRVMIKNKKMGDIKNTTAFPVANNLKQSFYIPHLTFFYDTILTISETYYKQMKDTDSIMTDFLNDSTKI